MFPWHSALPRDLVDRAYKWSNELAWSRADALNVLRLTQDAGYRILGIDTWLPTRPGPTPLIDDWSEDRTISAATFIETFQSPAADDHGRPLEPYFNFTL